MTGNTLAQLVKAWDSLEERKRLLRSEKVSAVNASLASANAPARDASHPVIDSSPGVKLWSENLDDATADATETDTRKPPPNPNPPGQPRTNFPKKTIA